MKPNHLPNLLLMLVFLAGCGSGGGNGGGGATSTSSLPTAEVSVTHVPSADNALHSYLDALLVEDYPTMYSLLTQASRDAISQDDFAKRYTDALNAMGVKSIEYNILSMLTDPQNSQVSFHIIYHTNLFSDIQRDFNTNLMLENGQWRLQWDESLILPELAGGKRLVDNSVSPARGDIYDRNGDAIATQTDAYALGLVAGEVSPDSETAVFYKLEQLTGVRRDIIRENYQNYAAGNYVPVGEASAEAVNAAYIMSYSGVQTSPYTSRFYEPNVAPNAVGYTLFISPADYNTYLRNGYSGAERIGWEGIEKWGESYLHGRNASTLYIASADGAVETVLAQVNSEPASSITLTIDSNLQKQAQAAMDGLPGAIVVMEVKTGRVLAMVSSPGFDPNWYDLDNVNRQFMDEQSTFNRAAQGTYPLGSVFKIITMAAALESEEFTPSTTYECGYAFTDIPGHTLYDWTWERCQLEKATNGTATCSGANAQPSGKLTLVQGLMRSCDPWFYHIGLSLWTLDKGNQISDMAKAFGLGSGTGIEQVAESKGSIPNPADGLQATSISIGQSDVQVTPLQVATFIAAIANGGTLYRPQLVEKIQPVSGEATSIFHPQANGTLPVSTANLKAIQEAMRSVVSDPRGTGQYPLRGFDMPVAAKTGTAESGATDPHAWFAGYSLANLPSKPDIAVAVIVNNKGEGATWAAPVFRRVMEIYFHGRPQAVYPWETTWGVIDPDYGTPAPNSDPRPVTGMPPGQNPAPFDLLSKSYRDTPGLIVRSQSGFFTVETENGLLTCHLRGRLKQGKHTGDIAAVGDRVKVTCQPDGTGSIESIEPRRSALVRQDPRPQGVYQQVILANPDQAVFVFACARPAPRLRMLDRFLVIAEKQELPAIIVANKIDLVGREQAEKMFGFYQPIGYPVIYTCATHALPEGHRGGEAGGTKETGQGVDELRERLTGKVTALAGPSGVGKSSLLNAIQPGLGLAVREISEAFKKGRHTTSVRQLFPVAGGGYVADTPGMRSLALWDTEPEELDGYFPELASLVTACQFNDCHHKNEPGCAVRAAVEAGRVHPQRYDSYLRLRAGEE